METDSADSEPLRDFTPSAEYSDSVSPLPKDTRCQYVELTEKSWSTPTSLANSTEKCHFKPLIPNNVDLPSPMDEKYSTDWLNDVRHLEELDKAS